MKSESLSVPLSIFNTDRTMRGGNKSDFAHKLRSEVGLERTNAIPLNDSTDSKYVVDGMALAYTVCTKNLKTLETTHECTVPKCIVFLVNM